MQATAVFYGRLRDRVRAERRAAALVEPVSLAAFRSRIAGDDPELAAELASSLIRVAINDVLVPLGEAVVVRPGDEVAFMPPFSGG